MATDVMREIFIKTKYVNKFLLMLAVMIVCLPFKSFGENLSDARLVITYSQEYKDRTNTAAQLVSFFTSDIRLQYEEDLKDGSRFISYPLSTILDSPVIIRLNRQVSQVDCAEYEVSSDVCVMILGKTVSGVAKKVLLGIESDNDVQLFNYVKIGNPEFANYYEWEQSE